MNSRALPANGSSTANSLEDSAFIIKDALLVIDEFVPSKESAGDRAKLQATAERVLRAIGNSSDRQRMRPDGTLRPARPPRGLILSTGEETPGGQSLRARMLVIEVTRKDICGGDLRGLTSYQKAAAQGVYASAMAGFLRWIATDGEGRVEWFRRLAGTYRDAAHSAACHARTASITGQLLAAWTVFFAFAVECGAISDADAKARMLSIRTALEELAGEQADIPAPE